MSRPPAPAAVSAGRDALEAALASVPGAHAALRTQPLEIDGVRVEPVLEPPDGRVLAASLRALGERGLAAIVRGRGTLDAFGNPPTRADVVLSTRALDGIEELDAQDGVVRVRAGTPLAALREAAAAQGWELPLDPAGDPSVGGCIAAASFGPRRLGHGAPRDVVLGLDVALATGERTHCGGRVVKNVTGYDLAKLYTGSFGQLGVIEAAWLRLRPRPERVVCLAASLAPGEPASSPLALDAARLASTRAAALLSPSVAEAIGTAGGAEQVAPAPGNAVLLVELAGPAPTVERDAAWLCERAGAAAVPGAALDALRDWQGASPGAQGMRARVAVLPSACGLVFGALRDAGASCVSHPGLGLVFAVWPAEPGGAAEAGALRGAFDALDACRRAVRGRAHVRFEALPLAHKRERDVFDDAEAATLPLLRALVARFDPKRVLNPGRFAGRLP